MGWESPPPTTYKIKSEFEAKTNGYSFGIPYSYYKKVHIEGLNTQSEDIPGPGTYDQWTTIGLNSLKFSFKSRVKP